LMPYEHFAGAEGVSVGAADRRVGDPLPGRGLYQLAQHVSSLRPTTGPR
jgi:hypothetical protein